MDLTAIGFIIAVVGVTLQLSDSFPEHRETRKVIVFMSIGLFFGILASAALGAKYNVTGNIDRRFALLFSLAALGALFGLIAVLVADEQRRNAAGAVAFCFGGAFLATGLLVAAGSVAPHYSYSTDEVLMLANAAERAGQYEVAIDRLEELDQRLKSVDASERLEKRVQKIRALQAGDTARP